MTSLDHMLVDDVMRRWPATIPVFLRHRMRCVGCPIALFHTVAEACAEHDVRLQPFIASLETAIDARAPPVMGTTGKAGPLETP